MSRTPSVSRRAQKPVGLLLYLVLFSIVAGGISGVRDSWTTLGAADFAIIIAGTLILAWPWVRSTSRIFAEIGWGKHFVGLFFAPTFLLVLVQLARPEPFREILAFIQIGFALILAFLAQRVRKELDIGSDNGRAA